MALFDLGAHTLRAAGSPSGNRASPSSRPTPEPVDEEPADDVDAQALPPLEAGEIVPKRGQQLLEKTTKPPKSYTDATLLDAMKTAGRLVSDDELAAFMKENGLGTPATRAATIEKLLDVGYAERKKKAIVPTTKGVALIAQVEPSLADPLTTAQWEQKLAQIEDGKAHARELEDGVAAWVETARARHPQEQAHGRRERRGVVRSVPEVQGGRRPQDAQGLGLQPLPRRRLQLRRVGGDLRPPGHGDGAAAAARGRLPPRRR